MASSRLLRIADGLTGTSASQSKHKWGTTTVSFRRCIVDRKRYQSLEKLSHFLPVVVDICKATGCADEPKVSKVGRDLLFEYVARFTHLKEEAEEELQLGARGRGERCQPQRSRVIEFSDSEDEEESSEEVEEGSDSNEEDDSSESLINFVERAEVDAQQQACARKRAALAHKDEQRRARMRKQKQDLRQAKRESQANSSVKRRRSSRS